nr:MAG TPA: hypothetical protein [Caudoviricetes sp.]
MQQIINGKKYDTETANYFGACEVTNLKCGFREHISLFRKDNGEYFLHNYLQELSWIGDHFINLSINPLTEEEAKKWAEKHLSVERYEAFLGKRME